MPLNSGAKFHFADVAPLFLYGTRSLAQPLPARAIEKKLRKMEFGTRFGMTPEFSGVVSHSRDVLARTMECREALARTME
ncbi:hypothetical protein Tco_0019718, partial [Tanacetum coccineum]